MKIVFRDYISILLHQTDLALTNCIKQALAPFNLAPEQNLIMMLLWEQDGLTQNEIARTLNKDKTNIARMLFNLEQKGYIRRMCVDQDRRSLTVSLTEEGKQLGCRVIPVAEHFNELVCRGISDEELATLRQILAKMCANIHK